MTAAVFVKSEHFVSRNAHAMEKNATLIYIYMYLFSIREDEVK